MEIKQVGVLGLGTQGQGIVEVSARAGYEVLVTTRSQASLEAGLALVRANIAKAVAKGKLSQPEMDAAWDHIQGTTEPTDFKDCDILIEAVREIIEEKKAVFALYDSICKPETIITTDTSTLPVIEMAMASGRPDRVIGTHFFWPVPVMKLVEVVVSIVTSDETLNTTLEYSRTIGKDPAIVKDSPGFINNSKEAT